MSGFTDNRRAAADLSQRLGFQWDTIQGAAVGHAVYRGVLLLVDICRLALEQVPAVICP